MHVLGCHLVDCGLLILGQLARRVLAKARAERYGVDRTDVHALAAGDAFVAVHDRAEVAPGKRVAVKGVQEAQPAARAAAAVADERGLIFTLYRKGGVYKPGALALLKYLHTLLTAYPVAAACADIVLRRVVKLDAGVLDWVLAALAEQTHGEAAGAVRHGEAFCLVHKGHDVLERIDLALGADLLHDRRDLHEAAVLAVDLTHERPHVLYVRKQLGHVRVVARFGVRHDVLVEAGYERSDVVEADVVDYALKDNSLLRHVLEHFLRLFLRQPGLAGKLGIGGGNFRDVGAENGLLLRNKVLEHQDIVRVLSLWAEKQSSVVADVIYEFTPCAACHTSSLFIPLFHILTCHMTRPIAIIIS